MRSTLKSSLGLEKVLNPKFSTFVGLITIHGKAMHDIPAPIANAVVTLEAGRVEDS